MNFRPGRRRLLQWLGLGAGVAGAVRPLPATPPSPQAPRAPVRVLFTRVNGETYYDAAERFPRLLAGDPVRLVREPDNPHDRRAIEVWDEDGFKLGYVARGDNSAVARMMDAGERFAARVARLTPPLDIRVEMHWLPG